MIYCKYCLAKIGKEASVCPYCGRNLLNEVPPHHLLPGTVLNDRYVVGAALGEGGFGITCVGLDTVLNQKVAIKEYYPSGYANRNNTVSQTISFGTTEARQAFCEKGKRRFMTEAATLSKFNSEDGIVSVYDFFEANNTAYIVMEFLDGKTLKEYLDERGKLAPGVTLSLMLPVMESLKKVHAQGLIHRDISPDNIMVVRGKVKLLDFGAARTVSALSDKSLSVMLKPGYAPEEQYRKRGIQGPWTDIYALCATMYKCITGVTPDDATERMHRDKVRFPSQLGIKIDPQLEAIIMKGFSVLQENRYQSIDELLFDLNGGPNSIPIEKPKAAFAASPAPEAAKPTPTANPEPSNSSKNKTTEKSSKGEARKRRPWILIPAFFLIVAAVISALLPTFNIDRPAPDNSDLPFFAFPMSDGVVLPGNNRFNITEDDESSDAPNNCTDLIYNLSTDP